MEIKILELKEVEFVNIRVGENMRMLEGTSDSRILIINGNEILDFPIVSLHCIDLKSDRAYEVFSVTDRETGRKVPLPFEQFKSRESLIRSFKDFYQNWDFSEFKKRCNESWDAHRQKGEKND